MSAAERLGGIVELLEMVLLALPLRDLLLARRISRTCRKIVECSAAIKDARDHPFVGARLRIPPQCPMTGPEHAKLDASLFLHFDRPLVVRFTYSPLETLSSFVDRYEEGNAAPDRPIWRHGWDPAQQDARRFSRANEWRFLELLPGTPYRLSYDFGPFAGRLGFEHLADVDSGMNRLEVGKAYLLAVQPGLRLSGYIGTKRTLLEKTDAGIAVESSRFEKVYSKVALRDCMGSKGIPLVGEGAVLFEVVA